eukprot:6201840-Prymnesium_polylepis.1
MPGRNCTVHVHVPTDLGARTASLVRAASGAAATAASRPTGRPHQPHPWPHCTARGSRVRHYMATWV